MFFPPQILLSVSWGKHYYGMDSDWTRQKMRETDFRNWIKVSPNKIFILPLLTGCQQMVGQMVQQWTEQRSLWKVLFSKNKYNICNEPYLNNVKKKVVTWGQRHLLELHTEEILWHIAVAFRLRCRICSGITLFFFKKKNQIFPLYLINTKTCLTI